MRALDSQPQDSSSALAPDWNAEYQFWHKIISEEVERLRFNEGYEPIRANLYETRAGLFMGKTQVGHVKFTVTGVWDYDKDGRKILKIEILKESHS